MGRVVCTLDRDAAAARDAAMLAQRAAGAPGLAPPRAAPFAAGCIVAGSPGAGTLFPQPSSGRGPRQLRLDDALGDTGWLISRTPVSDAPEGIVCADLASDELAPFRVKLETWLDQHGAEAVLVRPDRYVFGAGAPDALLAAWSSALGSRVGEEA
jgi:3-(3-hydroxy-phenyl)propionate hydroxylase